MFLSVITRRTRKREPSCHLSRQMASHKGGFGGLWDGRQTEPLSETGKSTVGPGTRESPGALTREGQVRRVQCHSTEGGRTYRHPYRRPEDA